MLDFVEKACEALEKIPGVSVWNKYERKNRSTIVVVLLSKELQVDQEKLDKARVAAHVQDGALYEADRSMRISFHYYNNWEDVKALCQAIQGCRE